MILKFYFIILKGKGNAVALLNFTAKNVMGNSTCFVDWPMQLNSYWEIHCIKKKKTHYFWTWTTDLLLPRGKGREWDGLEV